MTGPPSPLASKVMPPVDRRSWSLRAFQAAAGEPREVAALLLAAATHSRDAAGEPTLTAKYRAYEQFLGTPMALLNLLGVVRETSDPSNTAQWRVVDEAAHEAGLAFAELSRALGTATVVDLPAELRPFAAFFGCLADEARHLPSAEALPWMALSQTHGFTALGDLHRSLVRRELRGVAVAKDGQPISVSNENWRALLSHPDAAVRRQVWHLRAKVATEHRELFETIQRARQAIHVEGAALTQYASLLDSQLATWRISSQVVTALQAVSPRVRAISDRYYSWKRAQLKLDDFAECDTTARLMPVDADWVSLERMLAVLIRELDERAPRYAAVLRELLRGDTLLTDPAASASASWFVAPNERGALPLVHVPYHATLECFAAAAHELGHACHLTELAREQGEVLAGDPSLVYAEAFSTFFEITAVHGALATASSPRAARFFRAAAVEQALHFFRVLPTGSLFQAALVAGQEPREAWLQAYGALSPAWLSGPESGAPIWLLETQREESPFFGFGYAVAFTLGHALFTSGRENCVEELARRAPWAPITAVARDVLGLELERPRTFDAVLDQVEALIDELCEEE